MKIVLPFDSRSEEIGHFRATHVNFFRMYQSTGSLFQGGNLKLDQVRVINWKQFDPCEDYDMWYDGNTTLQRQWIFDTDNKKQGQGSMGFDNYLWNGANAFRLRLWEGLEYAMPFDMDETNAILKFWLYTDKPEFLMSQQLDVELSSSNSTSDTYDWSIPSNSLTLQKGWNEISLDFSKAWKSGAPTVNKINWFRFVLQMNTAISAEWLSLRINDIRVEKKEN